MTLQAVGSMLVYPSYASTAGGPIWRGSNSGVAFNSVFTIDAANEQGAVIGRVYWDGEPTSAKTMDSTSKIHFRTGTTTFADASTTLRLGIQDVSTTSTNTTIQPDNTFDVYADVVGNSGTITSSDDDTVKAITMTTGSKSITHGDLIAVVWKLTARAGSDSLIVTGLIGDTYRNLPASVVDLAAGTWSASTAGQQAAVILEASDGTLGIIWGLPMMAQASAEFNYQASTNPDEHGLIFQVPFRCKANSLILNITSDGSADADGTVRLYSTPLGTPAALITQTLPADQLLGTTAISPWCHLLAAPVVLEKNTDYCLALEATGTANIALNYLTLANAAHRSVMGLANCRHGYRDGQSGAFTEVTTEIPVMAIGISHIDDGTGMGSASMNIGGIY